MPSFGEGSPAASCCRTTRQIRKSRRNDIGIADGSALHRCRTVRQGGRMSDGSLRERLWRRFEGALDAFRDTDREVLPQEAWRFILYFARQAKGPFVLLLLVGGLAGAIDAAIYWSI